MVDVGYFQVSEAPTATAKEGTIEGKLVATIELKPTKARCS
jgi:hypothetical protein